MEDKKNKAQKDDFIVETPIFIEEKLGKDGKIRKYERGKFLGKGGFAKCYEMKCIETKKIYAAKIFEKKALTNARSRKKLINEIKLHKKLHHQNIVNFEHFFEDKDNVYILLELCNNQTLNELLKRRKRLTEIEVQCYLIQIIKALKYIHSHKIIHRDLKLGNCFITGKLELKLGDFGLAAKLEYEGQRRRTVCGTPNYIAPEILEKKNGHSYEVDIWSLGVVAFTLLFGRPPYETSDVKLTYKKIKMNSYSFPESIKVHPTAKKLISSILNLDPSKRPTLDAILEHEFFKIYISVPVVLPLSTLACPPSQKYLAQFNKNDNNLIAFHSPQMFNYTMNNSKYNSNLNKHIEELNLNSAENIKFTDSIGKDMLTRLLSQRDYLHKKSESMNTLNDDAIIDKVNNILQNANVYVDKNAQIGSRNSIKNDINFINSDRGNSTGRNNIQTKEDNIRFPTNENVINNNYFINVGNLNNMDIKFDDNILKKIEDEVITSLNNQNININQLKTMNPTAQLNFLNNILQNTNNPKQQFENKITKFYDYTNKFGVIFFINNTHIGVCFNDYSNIIKNVSLNSTDKSASNENILSNMNNIINHKSFEYIYIEKDAKATLNFDEEGFENYIKSSKTNKEIIKKFDIFKHILTKYKNDILSINGYFNTKIFYVKKFLKVQQAMMFRLSNKLIQVSFLDKNELIMSTESNDFLYKTNIDEVYETIQNAMNSDNAELIKRIKFTKNLLIHFVKIQKSKKVPK